LEQAVNSSGTTADDLRSMTATLRAIFSSSVRAGNYMVLKFHQGDGSLAWASSYDGPPGWYDTANCVIEGAGGEVIVSGFSTGATTDWDVATVGFAPEDGGLLWEKRHDTGDSLSDEASCMALSALGDLYVVGYGYDVVSASDLLTIRYLFDTASSVPEVAAQPEILAAGPNPFSTAITFSVRTAGSDPVALQILDLTGRLIAVPAGTPVKSDRVGSTVLTWDGRATDGAPVAPGVYVARLQNGRTTVGRTIVRIR
jgi:hypothetical protein